MHCCCKRNLKQEECPVGRNSNCICGLAEHREEKNRALQAQQTSQLTALALHRTCIYMQCFEEESVGNSID